MPYQAGKRTVCGCVGVWSPTVGPVDGLPCASSRVCPVKARVAALRDVNLPQSKRTALHGPVPALENHRPDLFLDGSAETRQPELNKTTTAM